MSRNLLEQSTAAGAIVLAGVLTAIASGGGGGGSDIGRVLEDIDETPWHQSAAIADMDGDSISDIVTVSHITDTNEASANVFLQRAGGSFAPKIEVSLGRARSRRVEHVLIRDVNLDGLPDVIVAHIGLTAGVDPGREVSVLLKSGFGGGDFAPYTSYDVADNPRRLAIADLDLDGLPDIAVATGGGTFLLLQDGANPGAFLEKRLLDSGRAYGLAVHDFTEDGLPDVLTAVDSEVRLLVNSAAEAGRFARQDSWTTPTAPSDLAIGDFNGDRRIDFAVALSRSDAFDRASVAYRLQDPVVAAQFGPEEEMLLSDVRIIGSLSARDLNGDGSEDLAAAISVGPDLATLAVLLTEPAGFQPPTLYSGPEEIGPWSAAIGQLGPDDEQDAVLAAALSGVFAQYGAGAGSFAAAVKVGE